MRADAPEVTIVVDGLEVGAREGEMLHDAAKRGDVEIPVFCYEPKLGEPVGACRMCLVEIEGIPKLQTSCSTPVRDGMVVYTQTDRVKEAQSAVVEFLLVNHPLDCPVCDKGGECPLQDIAMGWGPGKSRFSDPKRHFQKPIPLSPLVRIDRERCILCYRCVRFSQEVAEDEQLQLLGRGADTYVGTFGDRPYIAPFHGNVIELCPVGALTSEAYRFRARPWDIEDAGSICTLCPSHCNVKFTVRDEKVERVLARDNPAVDDGWLCDKGRFGFQMIGSPERITQPMVRRGGALAPAGWGEAIELAARGLAEARGRAAAIAGGGSSNEEGYLLQRLVREALESPHVTTGARPARAATLARALADPELAISIGEIDTAGSILLVGTDPMHEMPILDLRLRKAMRRGGARLAVLTDRPTSIDGGAAALARYAPGEAASALGRLAAVLSADSQAAEAEPGDEIAILAQSLSAGRTAIVFGERIGWGERGTEALEALLRIARALDLTAAGAGLIEVPRESNARGLVESGMSPTTGPGLAEAAGAAAGLDAEGIRRGLESKELGAVVLAGVDPVRDFPAGPAWERALKAGFVVSVAAFEGGSTAHADVVFPAESHAEKDGTATHPDGRVQRLRPNVPHPGDIRPGWQALVELCAALGHETGLQTSAMVLEALGRESAIYAGLDDEQIGGQGVRWQSREGAAQELRGAAARALETGANGANRSAAPGADSPSASANGDPSGAGGRPLRLGTYRDLWTGPGAEHSPALRFLVPGQAVELAPADAERLGLAAGDEVEVASNGTSVRARVELRERTPAGSAFMREATAEANANSLEWERPIEIRKA